MTSSGKDDAGTRSMSSGSSLTVGIETKSDSVDAMEMRRLFGERPVSNPGDHWDGDSGMSEDARSMASGSSLL